MKTRILKGIIPFTIIMLGIISVAGCNKKDVEKQDTGNQVYKGTEIVLDGIEGDFSKIFVQSGRMYIITNEWIDKEIGKSKQQREVSDEEKIKEENDTITRMYSANLDGSDIKEISLPELKGKEIISPLLIGEDSSITFLTSIYGGEKGITNSYLLKINEQGKEVFRKDITESLKKLGDTEINRILMDEKGRILCVLQNSLEIFDEKGDFFYEIKADSNLKGIARMKNGGIVCAFDDEDGATVRVLDIDKKEWGKTYKLDLQHFGNVDALLDGTQYDFYYRNDSGIYGYDIAGKKGTKIIDYIASNLNSESGYRILSVEKEQLFGTEWADDGKRETRLILYDKVDAAKVQEKEVIIIGVEGESTGIEEEIVAFNEKNKKYEIQIRHYLEGYDGILRMNADILAGKAPDIIVGLQNLPVEQYVSKGLLEDLTPYYEKDAEIKVEDILESVAEAMKINGKLYYVAPDFGIDTIAGKTEEVGEEGGCTIDDLIKLLREKGDGARLFYEENKSNMLYIFLNSSLNDFIDWNTGECFFDGQDFKNILEICNTGKNEEGVYNSEEKAELQREGKILLQEGMVYFYQMQVYQELFGGDITFIGYPNRDRQGSYFTFSQQMGICSNSDVKDGAWEFIRTFMTKEYQENKYVGIPTRADCLDIAIQKFGEAAEESSGFVDYGSVVIEIKPMTRENENKLKELINNTRRSGSSNAALMEIVQEEAKAYFAGDKDINEVVDIIQKRAITYVNENR